MTFSRQRLNRSIPGREEPVAPDLARDLEAYENPKAKMPVSWLKIYPDIPFDRQIDYNAQRLASTAINLAYWAANVETAKSLLHGDALAAIAHAL